MIRILFSILLSVGLWTSPAWAETYTFSCPQSADIKGSIHYSVIGSYRSIFQECSGSIVYDRRHQQPESVELKIKTASIKSNCPWCDKVVRSKRVFDTRLYPVITFQSSRFEHVGGAWWVIGRFDIHGVVKTARYPFKLEEDNGALGVSGLWRFNRKDFNVIWNKVLDHGGVVVGDYVTVDWKARARKI
jgi:polyisoprenoid-binding protein YceI